MSFEEQCIEAHNRYRRMHQSPPLKQKDELTRHAQRYANHVAETGKYVHSEDSSYGENMAMTTKVNPPAEDITKMWYDEIDQFNFQRPQFSPNVGHFTQLVWKETTHIGVGIARGKTGTYVVANYEPAGNITNPGYFEKNVLPPVEGSSSSGRCQSGKDSGQMPKSGTTVETKVREYRDKDGHLLKETTTITKTTTVTPNGATSTSTSTKTQTEYIESKGGVRAKGEEG